MHAPPSPPAQRLSAVPVPWRLVCLAAAVPCVLALWQLGRLHPDEVFQYLEPAHHRAFGYGILAWEWQQGLRNWAIPGLLSWLLSACAAVGIDDVWARRAVLELPLYGLHVLAMAAVYRLCARRLPAPLARWSLALVGLYYPVLTFAGRTMSETFSTAFLLIAVDWLDRRGQVLYAAWGGVALGLSVVARYGTGAAVVGIVAWLLIERRWREAAATVGAGLGVALLLGLLDLQTWGSFLHSFRAYYAFNVQSGQAAAQFGGEPWWFYLRWLGVLAPFAWPGFIGFFRSPALRLFSLVAGAATYLVAISAVAHKEVRFIYPALVLLCVAATPAALALLQKAAVPALKPLAAAASLPFFWLDSPLQAERPEQFRLEAKAARAATGFFIIPEGVWGSGGYFWLGKNIPWFTCDFANDGRFVAAMRDPRFNRVVSFDGHAEAELAQAGFQVLERDGRAALWGRQ